MVRCGNQKVIGTLDSLLLYGSMYVSEMVAAIGICLSGGMCQIPWLPHGTDLCLYGGMCQTCWLPKVSVSMEVCERLYSVG